MRFGLSKARNTIKMKVSIFKNQFFFVSDINAKFPKVPDFNSFSFKNDFVSEIVLPTTQW